MICQRIEQMIFNDNFDLNILSLHQTPQRLELLRWARTHPPNPLLLKREGVVSYL
jgi:hypothetical protein